MTEALLQYLWQFQYFNRSNLQTTTGEPIAILFQGRLNTHQGPDFLDARIKIGNTVLVGAVELHLKTSDWQRHGHTGDVNYNGVILHVVLQHNALFQNPIPVLELQSRISSLLLDRYTALMETSPFIPCASTIAQTSELTWLSWKERLLAERLTRKAAAVHQLFEQTGHHWEETLWRLLARNFGLKVNADAFEAIARTLPMTIVAKHRNSVVQLEALLLGQTNLLAAQSTDEYTALLQREYRFLQAKFALTPIAMPIHFLRMRPGNFPTVRLAQLAMLLHTRSHLFSFIVETTDLADVKKAFQVTASDYWDTHYRPGVLAAKQPKRVGSTMVDSLIINTIVPVLFAYGLYHDQEAPKEKALLWLQQTAAEQNIVTAGFEALAVANKSAYDSQALLELKHEYCDTRRCLQCAVGNALLKGSR